MRGWAIAAGIVVLLGFVLRIADFDEYWLNPDEGIYWSMLSWSDFGRFWDEFLGNAHPPLYFLVLRGIGALSDEFAAFRGVALVSGVAAIWVTWLLARELAHDAPETRREVFALVAALLLAISPSAVMQSQIMRPYMFLLLELGVAALFVLRWLRLAATRAMAPTVQAGSDGASEGTGERVSNRSLIFASLAMLLAVLTHYSSFLVLAVLVAVAGFAVLRSRALGRAELLRLGIAFAIPGLVAITLFFVHIRPHVMAQAAEQVGDSLESQAVEGWLRPFFIFGLGQVWTNFVGFVALFVGDALVGAATIALLAGFVLLGVQRRFELLLLSGGLLALMILAAAAKKYPFGCSRHSSHALGLVPLPLAWTIACAATWRGREWLGAILLAGLAAAYSPLHALVGATQTTTHVLPERAAKRSEINSFVEQLAATPGKDPMLIAARTYYSLLPLFADVRENATVGSDERYRFFEWRGRTVVAAQSWKLEIRPQDLAKPEHLFNLARLVETEHPEIGLAKSDRVLMAFAGWAMDIPDTIVKADLAAPPAHRLVASRPFGSQHCAAFHYRLATYVRRIANARRKD